MYVIIQTNEDDMECVSICSTAWIINDILYWPPKSVSTSRALRKHLLPDQAKWRSYHKFKILANQIGSYNEAKQKEIYYTKYTNSESEKEHLKRKNKLRKHPALVLHDEEDYDYNNLFKDVERDCRGVQGSSINQDSYYDNIEKLQEQLHVNNTLCNENNIEYYSCQNNDRNQILTTAEIHEMPFSLQKAHQFSNVEVVEVEHLKPTVNTQNELASSQATKITENVKNNLVNEIVCNATVYDQEENADFQQNVVDDISHLVLPINIVSKKQQKEKTMLKKNLLGKGASSAVKENVDPENIHISGGPYYSLAKINAELEGIKKTITKNKTKIKQILEDTAEIKNDVSNLNSNIINLTQMMQTKIAHSIAAESNDVKQDDLFEMATLPINTIERFLKFNRLLLAKEYLEQTDSELCISLAFSLQYVRLCAFCWMLIMTYHMYSQFRTGLHLVPITDHNITKHFLRYSLFGWGLPFVLLGASILIQYHDKAGKLLDTATLKGQNCWFLDRNAFLYGLIIPCCLIVVATLFYLARSAVLARYIISMQADRRIREKMSRKRTLQILLFAKIMFVLSAVLSLGAASKLYKNEMIWISYHVAQGIQGVLIALLVTCNCQVLKLYTKSIKSRAARHVPSYVGGRNVATSSVSKSTSLQLLTWEPAPDSV